MKEIISTLDSKDASELERGLKELIAQTYVIEAEYKALKSSYDSMLKMINDIINRLPQAVWVLENNGDEFLANQSASAAMLKAIKSHDQDEFELNFCGEDYLVRKEIFADKELLTATNITKQKRAARLQNMGQIATQLAHEIRNPIGSLMLMCSHLAKKASPKEQEIIADMSAAIARVEQIIKNTLQFSREVKPQCEQISTQQIANECEKLAAMAQAASEDEDGDFGVAASGGADGARYVIDFAACRVRADLQLLSQALGNLIYNAFEAGQNVQIIGRKKPPFYEIAVMDDGEQIAQSQRLFEAFYTTKLRGNGLGLAIAQQIAIAHGGKLEYRDTPKAFLLLLPL